MKFIIFVIDTESSSANQTEMEGIDKFNEFLRDNNHLVMAAGIGAPLSAKLIDNRKEKTSIDDRSNFDGPEFYSGFWIIDVPNNEIAAEIAIEASKACNRKVELRPFLN